MVDGLDPLGLPIRVQRPESLAAVGGFVSGFLAYEPQILAVLEAAKHDHSLIVQTLAAVLWMFSESPAGPPQARAHLQCARAAALPATEREQSLAAAVAAWVEGDLTSVHTRHAEHTARWPRDLAALKLGQLQAFNLGDAPTMLRLAWTARGAAADTAFWHGLAAFAFEQCHRLHEAEVHARQALALRAHEPWAEHALAHVLLTEGRFAEGRDFMARASPPWRGLTSFMRTHNFWHLALFRLELGEDAAALALYDDEVWGVDTGYSQDQVGAVSLLARLEWAGVDVGPRWQALAEHLAGRVHDQVLPFLDLQYLYGLARAGRPEADAMLAAIVAHAAQVSGPARSAWQQVAVPAAHGLLAHGRAMAEPARARREDWDSAAAALGQAVPRLLAIGGSHAQRDLFEQLWLDAAEHAGDAATVLNVLQPRAHAHPASQRLARRLQRVHASLGLPAPA